MLQMMEPRARVLLILVFVLPLLALACRDFDNRAGSSGLIPPPEITAAGVWEGDWSTLVGGSDSGQVTFVVSQDDFGVLSGCSCWTGSACWDDGLFSGAVSDGSISGATVMEILRDPSGTVPRLLPTVVNGRMDLIGDLLTGSFTVQRDDARRCTDEVARTGDEGSISLERTSTQNGAVEICTAMAAEADCSDFVLP